MVYTIKILQPDDWEILRQVRLKALQADPSVFGLNYQKEAGRTEDDWRGWLRDESRACFVIAENGEPVGMTGIAVDRDDPAGKSAFLWGSWLESHMRGKGLSKIIYEARIDWARNNPNLEKIIVSHRASNLSSKFANQKHGFIFTHRISKLWPDGTEEDSLYYELPL